MNIFLRPPCFATTGYVHRMHLLKVQTLLRVNMGLSQEQTKDVLEVGNRCTTESIVFAFAIIHMNVYRKKSLEGQ